MGDFTITESDPFRIFCQGCPDPSFVVSVGSAEGGAPFVSVFVHGDIENVRNVQGGRDDSPNLDLGAGSNLKRGNIVLNWDVGNRTRVYDGHKTLTADLGGGKHHLYAPAYLHRGALVPDGHGGWRPV